MCVGRWIWLPAGALRARPAMCGALGRASVNSDAANQRIQTHVVPFHREVPYLESTAPKKGSAKSKTASGARSRLPRPPPRNRRGLLN